MSSLLPRIIVIALISFLLGSLLDEAFNLEARFGLAALFNARSVRQVPDTVAIISLDEYSKKEYGIGADFTQWRAKHAGLIEELQRQGVALIVFDFYFGDPQLQVDPALARAIKAAGNVLAGDCLQTALSASNECGSKVPPSQAVQINPPTPQLAAALLDNGLFYLGNDPDQPVIQQSWTFLEQFKAMPLSQPAPSLPVLAWVHYLKRNGGGTGVFPNNIPLSKWLAEQRQHCVQKKLSDKSAIKSQLFDLICQGNSRFLDYYGPPKTITMLSYSDVREGRVTNLRGKVVFIGQVPRETLPAPQDSFVTPFTDADSGRMTGVEIMATSFANLLEGRHLKPLVAPGWVMAGYALVISLLLVRFNGLPGIVVSVLVSGGYWALALGLFSRHALWLPVMVPFSEWLMALLLALYWAHRDHVREEARLKAIIDQITADNNRLVSQFIGRLHASDDHHLKVQGKGLKEEVTGVCLATDLEGYTTFSEQTESSILTDMLRDYYHLLSAITSMHGGKIVNIAGDGMIAIWVDPALANKARAACRAALEMRQALQTFGNDAGHFNLPTRFGLHEGRFTLASLTRFLPDNNPVGFSINLASRIEGANKKLSTTILASQTVAENQPKIVFRPVGCFLLQGAHTPTDLYEVIGLNGEVAKNYQTYCRQFNKGLTAFKAGQWESARQLFSTLNKEQPDDGPANYYLALAKTFEQTPPVNWPGYIKLNK